jgi:hypothetical protein
VSHIRPNDLVELTTTCQNINAQIRMNEAQVKANLLTKTLCPGLGLLARKLSHCPCKTRGWNTYIGCGGEGYDVHSKPCAECGLNTCDECRIHVVYQTFMEDPGLDNRRWWAGHVLNIPTPFGLLPPRGADGDAWNLPADLMRSHHDQGRFHAPLSVYAVADPEPLDRILDTNLGLRDITPVGRTNMPFDGENVVGIFQTITELRKEMLCGDCAEECELADLAPCSCTLRKRFVDRWVCASCFQKEHASDWELSHSHLVVHGAGHVVVREHCSCCDQISPGNYKMRCNWCDGHIPNETENDGEDIHDAAEEDVRNNDDDDENAGPAPTDPPANRPVQVENKDGSLSIFWNGTRISGERLSRAMVIGWLVDTGVELPCQCCKCPSRLCDHHRNYGHSHDHDHDHHEDGGGEEEEGGTGTEEHGLEETGEGYDEESIDFDEESIDFDEESIDFDEEAEPDVYEDDEPDLSEDDG